MTVFNQLLRVPRTVEVPDERNPGCVKHVQNPDISRLRRGEYSPPEGWRAVSASQDDDGVLLLLERDAVEHPYR